MFFIKESFYDWCIKNNVKEALERWDYELNSVTPNDISSWDKTKYYFKCENGIHRSSLQSPFFIRRYKKVTQCQRCNSFGMWCIKNNKLDILKRWDCELNKVSPFEVSYSSGKKYWFKCPKGIHDSELKYISNLIKQEGSQRCNQCLSIGQYLIDTYGNNGIKLYWSDKNNIDPYTVPALSVKKYWFKCSEKDYHEDYQCTCVNFCKGRRCPYCASKKINYYDSLGYLYPEVLEIWSDKNKKSPYDYFPKSNQKVWWKCDSHEDYFRKISDSIKANFRCPNCVAEMDTSILQSKVSDYIKSLYNEIRHEEECTLSPINPKTGCRLRYDNEIIELKLIIEVNGIQHYKITTFTKLSAKHKGISPEEEFECQKWKDKFKRDYAISHGYFYLEIPYYSDDKIETYKSLIDNKIKGIKLHNIA